MICPACKKNGPAGFKCRSCGAEMMRGRHRAGDAKSGGGAGNRPTTAAAAGAVENPYATPQRAALGSAFPSSSSEALASRGARLAASLIDGLAVLVILLPLFGAVFFVEGSSASSMAAIFIAVSGLSLLVFAVYQIRMLIREGQTLGKRMMSIRIVNHGDGQLPSAGRLLGMRYFVNSLLGNIPLYSILDVLFIFGNEQRCLHDYLAGTKVVEA